MKLRWKNKDIFNITTLQWGAILVVSFSILIERMIVIGQPNLSVVRFAFSLVPALLFFIWYARNLTRVTFNVPRATYFLVIIVLLLYEWAMIATNNNAVLLAFSVYIGYAFIGYFQFGLNSVRYINRLIALAVIAGIIGWVFWLLGPDKLLTLGIGPISRLWGQNVLLRNSLFRSYSIFGDHQTYSAFMQVVGLIARLDDYCNPSKKKKYMLAFLFFLSIPTFSTTGLLVFLIFGMSYLPKFAILGIVGVCAPLITSFAFVDNAYYHGESLYWRLLFISRQISEITLYPHPNVSYELIEGGNGGFTSDCFFLTRCLSLGAIWGGIYLIHLFSMYALVRPKYYGAVHLIIVFFAVNTVTNGLPYTATPLNVITPIFMGIILRRFSSDQVY